MGCVLWPEVKGKGGESESRGNTLHAVTPIARPALEVGDRYNHDILAIDAIDQGIGEFVEQLPAVNAINW